MEQFQISQELAQKIINYLVEQKYREVAPLIAEMVQLRPAKKEEPVKDKPLEE
jgi:hypothetical protein